VRDPLVAAHERGVAVRLAYNHEHRNPIPVPPPPSTEPGLIESLPVPTRGVPGVPDLMHHKYVVRDGAAVWTGSANWTEDSWSKQENLYATVESNAVARAYTQDFDELWTGSVEASGTVDPAPVEVGGATVRAWFTPGHGRELSHRIGEAIGRATGRVRIASPVITAAPVIATLAQEASEGKLDLAGVVDGTQMARVFQQWEDNGNSRWKLPLVATFLPAFAGKPSIPWTPDSVHDFMHAKVTVADDTVFLGSFNLSRSGEMNAENVLEIEDAALAERMAAYIDGIRARYPAAPLPR